MAVNEAERRTGLDAALDEARAAIEDAGVQGLCREGREEIALAVLRRYGVADAELLAARLASETENPT